MGKSVGKIGNFAESAKELSKDPLGIIALFIVLAYGMATLVIITVFTTFTDTERFLLTCFIVFFPVLLLISFVFLVVFHNPKLRREDRKHTSLLQEIRKQHSSLLQEIRKQTKNDSDFEEIEPLKKRQRRK